jgi:hypothetical protein
MDVGVTNQQLIHHRCSDQIGTVVRRGENEFPVFNVRIRPIYFQKIFNARWSLTIPRKKPKCDARTYAFDGPELKVIGLNNIPFGGQVPCTLTTFLLRPPKSCLTLPLAARKRSDSLPFPSCKLSKHLRTKEPQRVPYRRSARC